MPIFAHGVQARLPAPRRRRNARHGGTPREGPNTQGQADDSAAERHGPLMAGLCFRLAVVVAVGGFTTVAVSHLPARVEFAQEPSTRAGNTVARAAPTRHEFAQVEKNLARPIAGSQLTTTVLPRTAATSQWKVTLQEVYFGPRAVGGARASSVRSPLRSTSPAPVPEATSAPSTSAPTTTGSEVRLPQPTTPRTAPALQRQLLYWVAAIIGVMLLLAGAVYRSRDRS